MDYLDHQKAAQAMDGLTFPGKRFARAVLEPVFLTQRDHYYRAFLEISLAHAAMLGEQGILAREEAGRLIAALRQIEGQDFSRAQYDPAYEDMFFMLEKALEALVGADLAGRLHIARSRNDIDVCEFRMVLREKLLGLLARLADLMEVLLSLCARHTQTIMPAYTHTQPAQPTTLAHYLLAFYDVLRRDYDRVLSAYRAVNQCPIGAAAITTTGFPISRERMCALLGFDQLVENSYDAIAGVDYLTECAGSLMGLGVDLSRFLKDALDYCTAEFGYFHLADPYVQTSSIMPQKRNPSSLEHARPLASQVIALAGCAFTMLHNTPFGDMVDCEEQLQPRLYDAFTCADRVLTLLTANLATLTVNVETMRRRAEEGLITATELADTLVREHGLSFRESHFIAAAVSRSLCREGKSQQSLTAGEVEAILREATGRDIALTAEEIALALDPAHFVAIRGVTGGPAQAETARMINNRTLDDPRAQLDALKGALEQSRALLHSALQTAVDSLN